MLLSRNFILMGTRNFQYAKLLDCGQSRMASQTTKNTKFKALMEKTSFRLGMYGVGIATVAVGTYGWEMYKRSKIIPIVTSTDTLLDPYLLKESPPKFPPSRTIKSSADQSGIKLTLYQYQTCPFCCKVRAFLDYFGFSYDVIEVNSVTRKQTKWTDYRKVPFVLIEMPDGKTIYQLKDSSMIISALYSILINSEMSLKDIIKSYPIQSYMDDEGQTKSEIMNRYFLMYGNAKVDKEQKDAIANERKWRRWVDDVFVHTLSPNVYRTPTEAYHAFQWFSEVGNWEEHFATWERLLVVYVGAAAMFIIGKNLKKRHHLKDDVRQSLYDEARNWDKSIDKKQGIFMGGQEPNLADLNAYGILTAIEGCQSFQDLIYNTKIKKWFYNMKTKVNEKSGSHYLTEKGAITN